MTNVSTTKCSDWAPSASEFFEGRSTAETILIGLAGAVALVTIIIYFENAVFLIRQFGFKRVTRLTLWLTGIHPLFAFTSIMSLYIPRTAPMNDFIATVYLSVSIYLFVQLMIGYHGGEEKLIQAMADTKIPLRSPPLACCCCCCPEIPVTRKNLQIIKCCVLQVAIIRPVLLYSGAVILANRNSRSKEVTFTNAFTFMAVIGGVSTLVAMYSLILVFRASRKLLKEFNIIPKFLNLQFLLVICNLQSMVFQMLARFDLPPCRENTTTPSEGNAMHHMLLAAEVFLLSLLSRCYYREVKDPVILVEIKAGPSDNMCYETDVGNEDKNSTDFNIEGIKTRL